MLFPEVLSVPKTVFFSPPQPLWKAAVAQFERLITPSEQEVAGRLKAYIADVQDNPQQVVKHVTSATVWNQMSRHQ